MGYIIQMCVGKDCEYLIISWIAKTIIIIIIIVVVVVIMIFLR